MAKKKKSIRCNPTFKISQAGHLLSTKGSSKAGSILSREGKREKAKRRARGCLKGLGEVFQLTERQKKKLPLKLQKAILEHHRKQGRKIIP